MAIGASLAALFAFGHRLVAFGHRLDAVEQQPLEPRLVERTLKPGVTWFGWTVPVALEVFMVFALGIAMLAIAIWEFSAGE